MRYAIDLAVLAVAGVAHAGPVAQATADFDGAATQVSVGGDGMVTIGAARVALGRALATATIGSAVVRGTPTVVVSGDDEAFVLERDGATWKLAHREPIGGVGLDHDYATRLDPTPAGLIKYQARPGFARCDGKPAYLFAEGWTGSKFQRLSRIPTLVPDGAPVIAAHADRAAAAPPVLYQARVASYEPGAADAGALGIPAELDDGRVDTAWHEDFVKSDGEGQFFTFEPRAAGAQAAELRVVPGDGKHANRPHRLAIVAAAGAWHVELPDSEPPGTAFVAELPAPVAGCVTIVLESSYGPPSGATAIAELEVFADGERAGGGEAMLAAAIADGKDTQAASQELARRGAAGVAAIDAELGKPHDAAARRRLVRAAAATRDASVGAVLARAIDEHWIDGADELDAIATLGAVGAFPALRDLAKQDHASVEARVAAVRALAGAPELVIELAGHGPRELRRAVIEVATGAPLAKLVEAASAADVWRAVTRRARANAGERPAALAAMVGALATANDYEHRYRLVDGIATIGDAPALAQLAAMLRALPDDAQRAALEQVAARGLAENPRPEGLDLVTALARDPDPGVRLAALHALAGADGGTAGPWHVAPGPDAIDGMLGTALATDPWPELRARAAQALGSRCTRLGAARSLEAAVARDHELAVRGDALAALVQCAAPTAASLLARTWDDRKAPVPLRQRAIDLAVELADRALAAQLVGKFRAWRGAALDSADALALAQNAAYALGRLAPPGAADALADGLGDTAFPEIVAASATGLGLLGNACPAGMRDRLRALAGSDEQQVAVAAARAAALCGR